MRALNLCLPTDDSPLYRRLARAVRQAVQEGQVQPGELLPSTRQLGQRTGAHRHTVMAALDELVAEGWLVAEAGRGYRVISALPGDIRRAPASNSPRQAVAWRLVRDAADPRDRPDPALPYAFPSGQPDLRLFPTADYYSCVREVLRDRPADTLLGYADPGGVPALLEQLRIYLRRMRGVSHGSIVVTHGSQEAIFLLAQLLVKPGDYLEAVRRHERTHSDLMGQALGSCDPARDAEHAYGKEPGRLRDQVKKGLVNAARTLHDRAKDPLLDFMWTGNLAVPQKGTSTWRFFEVKVGGPGYGSF